MRLFLILFLGLFLFGCGEEDAEDQSPEGVKEKIEKEKQAGDVVSIFHKADDSEEVLFSYENPHTKKAVSRFAVQPGSCFKFTDTQLQFVKSVEVGEGCALGGGYKILCGRAVAVTEEKQGIVDRVSSERKKVQQAINDSVGKGEEKESGEEEEKIPSCNILLRESSYDIVNEETSFMPLINCDNYILKKAAENSSQDCKFFEDTLAAVSSESPKGSNQSEGAEKTTAEKTNGGS